MSTNNFSARSMASVVYDAEGNKIETTRPNAKDLVSSGKYFYNNDGSNAAGNDLDETPSAEGGTLTIFNAEGTEFRVSRANARDLLRSGYTLKNPNAPDETNVVEEEPEVVSEEINEPEEPAAPAPTAEDPLDPVNSPLAEIAQRVTGNEDVAAYLETFSDDNLRQMSDERYGEKPHHRASKAKIIEKIIELEDAKLSAD